MNHHTALDIFRTITLGLDAAVAGYVLYVFDRFRHLSKASQSLRFHVMVVTLAALVALASLSLDTIDRVGQTFAWWQTPLNFVYALLMAIGMNRMISYLALERVAATSGIKGQTPRQPERRKSFSYRDDTIPLAVRITWLMMVVMVVFTLFSFGHLSDRVGKDETQTCIIQSRGLPASHALAAAMRDIHTLIVQPVPKGTVEAPRVTRAVADLKDHLSTYLRITAQQPATRTC